jgi:hypothetical protein
MLQQASFSDKSHTWGNARPRRRLRPTVLMQTDAGRNEACGPHWQRRDLGVRAGAGDPLPEVRHKVADAIVIVSYGDEGDYPRGDRAFHLLCADTDHDRDTTASPNCLIMSARPSTFGPVRATRAPRAVRSMRDRRPTEAERAFVRARARQAAQAIFESERHLMPDAAPKKDSCE